jgi:uncharacterized membrane-anchored protein
MSLTDHPDRIKLANELHARPFPLLQVPCRVSHIAVSAPPDEQGPARQHMLDLCARFGASLPAESAPQHNIDLGRFTVKWEWHTEFLALSVMAGAASPAHTPFAEPAITLLPKDWLARIPGTVLAAIHVHGEAVSGEAGGLGDHAIPAHLAPHFSLDSLIGGSFFDDTARFWGDFRIHEDGFMRFAVRTVPNFERALMGRIAQRLIEVETYRAASMLALPTARGVWPQLNTIDKALAETTAAVGSDAPVSERKMLDRITELSARIETITSENAYRLDASRAYAAIVWRRLEVLSASPLPGHMNLASFMARRYDPAMRSCEATRARLTTLSERAERAATLLRTRIDVSLEEQNREVLASMNERSARQLRLQETVEGLSIVAISYYAVSLAALLVAPMAKGIGISAIWAKAMLVLPVVALVWMFVQRVKRHALEAAKKDLDE